MALETITTDPDSAWAISAYGGVSVLIESDQSMSVYLLSSVLKLSGGSSAGESLSSSLGELGGGGGLRISLQLNPYGH
ncbi:hypothetical protein LguiB_029981 [Lonicera macranthoides]